VLADLGRLMHGARSLSAQASPQANPSGVQAAAAEGAAELAADARARPPVTNAASDLPDEAASAPLRREATTPGAPRDIGEATNTSHTPPGTAESNDGEVTAAWWARADDSIVATVNADALMRAALSRTSLRKQRLSADPTFSGAAAAATAGAGGEVGEGGAIDAPTKASPSTVSASAPERSSDASRALLDFGQMSAMAASDAADTARRRSLLSAARATLSLSGALVDSMRPSATAAAATADADAGPAATTTTSNTDSQLLDDEGERRRSIDARSVLSCGGVPVHLSLADTHTGDSPQPSVTPPLLVPVGAPSSERRGQRKPSVTHASLAMGSVGGGTVRGPGASTSSSPPSRSAPVSQQPPPASAGAASTATTVFSVDDQAGTDWQRRGQAGATARSVFEAPPGRLRKLPSAIMRYGASSRDEDLTKIQNIGRALQAAQRAAREHVMKTSGGASSMVAALLGGSGSLPNAVDGGGGGGTEGAGAVGSGPMNADAALAQQLLDEADALLDELDPIAGVLAEEQRVRRSYFTAMRRAATDEIHELTSALMLKQREVLAKREARRDLVRQYLVWRQTRRADAAMVSASFEEHLAAHKRRRTVGTQCTVAMEALPVQLVRTVRLMQELPNLQRHATEVRKLVVELQSVDSKSAEVLSCPVCSRPIDESVLIWPCGDTVCYRCARASLREFADQPFKQCPACRMLSLTEQFNVTPNTVVSQVVARWRFKLSGFHDVAAASDALQRRLASYKHEEVMRAYEAVQRVTVMAAQSGDLHSVAEVDIAPQ
jgi:hypothetical protein